MDTAGDKTSDVGHVNHEQRPRFVGDGAKTREVYEPRVGRIPGDDELGARLFRESPDGFVVQCLRLLVHAIWHEVIKVAGDVMISPLTFTRPSAMSSSVCCWGIIYYDTSFGIGV